MADFLLMEAEESDDDLMDLTPAERRLAKKLKLTKDDDIDDRYAEDIDDLINDEEEFSDHEEYRHKKTRNRNRNRNRKRKHDYILDDDDYDLLEERMGKKFKRNKFSRVQRIVESDDDEEQNSNPDKIRAAIADKLFEESYENVIKQKPVKRQNDLYADLSESDYDYDDDFIVRDDDETNTKQTRPRVNKARDSFENSDEEDKTEIQENRNSKTIHEMYEPREIEKLFLTRNDQEIQLCDLPERFQLRLVAVTKANDADLDEEAKWIYKNAFLSPTQDKIIPNAESDRLISKIRAVVNLIRNDQFEIPFIAQYRKEFIEPELSRNDLWTVYKWDEKFCQLKKGKESLIRLYKNMQNYHAENPKRDNSRIITDNDIARLRKIDKLEMIRDEHIHFMLHYEADKALLMRKKKQQEIENDKTVKLKQAIRNNTYSICLRSGIGELVEKYGLCPIKFSENLMGNSSQTVDHDILDPIEASRAYICSKFPTPDEVLKAARFVLSTQLSKEPLVRQYFRSLYFTHAKLSIKSTKKGLSVIDENHPCYSVTYVKNKPIKDLQSDQFLHIYLAEKDGLLSTTICLDESSPLSKIKRFYHGSSQEWNDERSKVIDLLLNNILFPCFENELRRKLIKEAKDSVIKSCVEKFRKWLNVAPFEVRSRIRRQSDYDTKNGIRVMAIAYSFDQEAAAYVALVSGDGEVTDVKNISQILKKKTYKFQRQVKLDELNRVKEFIESRKPHVVVVSAESNAANLIVQDLRNVIKELVDSGDFPEISVELADNNLASTYMKSKRSQSDFPDHKPIVRQAISLARRLQDPLTEFAQLFTPDEDILNLQFHPLQNNVSNEDLLDAIQLEFINFTNEVGVDVNKAVLNQRTANLLQFVSGLGPRKSSAILRSLRGDCVENRTQLVDKCRIGPKVFANCAGFIKINTDSLNEVNESNIEILDRSRVHPEAYNWARKMAVDALKLKKNRDPNDAIYKILDNPDKLKNVNLDKFAHELEQSFGDQYITLVDIRNELYCMFEETRKEYRSATPEEKLEMITKLDWDCLHIGKLVSVTVTAIARSKVHQKAAGVNVRLDNGMFGFIPLRNICDQFIRNPDESVQMGMSLQCRITRIDYNFCSVELTSRQSDVIDRYGKWRPPLDPYFDYDLKRSFKEVVKDVKIPKEEIRKPTSLYDHPCFRNITHTETEQIIRNKDQGEVIFRPSSKGPDHLTLTWKVTEGINQLIDVIVKRKESNSCKSFWIHNEEFDDLDEIIARFVQPMAAHIRDICRFKYFRDSNGGSKQIMEKLLMDERKLNPSKIPYFITSSKDLPGKFMLSYMPRQNSYHEFLSVIPNGYRFRDKVFQSLDNLFSWFKENFKNVILPVTTLNQNTSKIILKNNGNCNRMEKQDWGKAAREWANRLI